jgi:hypothetical protein
MLVIQLNSITGATPPYNLFICDVYGNQCVVLATINTPIPPSITLNVPSQFNNVPAIGLKIIDYYGCEQFEIINCGDVNGKIFQSAEVFLFMDGNIYIFEDQ